VRVILSTDILRAQKTHFNITAISHVVKDCVLGRVNGFKDLKPKFSHVIFNTVNSSASTLPKHGTLHAPVKSLRQFCTELRSDADTKLS
jgi:predicted RNA binding protein YcfA (HicA-like mRNA interferase family)